MNFQAKILPTLIGVVGILLTIEGFKISNINEETGINWLSYLGEVDGRTYYADANQKVTWKDAHAFCRREGYELASIDTENQAKFLKDALSTSYKSQWFWTGGRENPMPEGYVWDNSKTKPDVKLIDDWIHYGDAMNEDYKYCIMVLANSNLVEGFYNCQEKQPILRQTIKK